MSRTQTKRRLAVATPLADDKLLLASLRGSEALGRPFAFELELYAEDDSIQASDLLGQNVTVRLEVASRGTRYFNGYVSRFGQSVSKSELATYRATLVPWLWFLTRCADCRIFQDKTVPEILKEVFRDRGFTDFEEHLSGSYAARPYCVQYRETDFNFVSRLMEQEGIYYYFTHDNGRHTMVLADSPAAHGPAEGYAQVRYHARSSGYSGGDEINAWSMGFELQPGAVALSDFDFEKPTKDLGSRATQPREHANAEFEIFDYPGEYVEVADGEAVARTRLGELAAQHEVAVGRGEVRGLWPGCKFRLTDSPRKDQDRDYLVTSATYRFAADTYGSNEGRNGDADEAFTCDFTAIDASVHFRPPRLTPKPVVQGPQTAVVVGKKGEEVWTDRFGRVKVRFHWDRHGKSDETGSCWIRVAQGWAGRKWGALFLPRIGQEVVVEFLEGDPDRPIVTACIYNGDCMPPYDLPSNATRSTIKSLTSKGGGGFNEIRFEDKAGSEQLFVHAQKDHDLRVRDVTREWVGKDRHLIVKNDQFEQVNGDKHLTVKGDQNEAVEGTVSLRTGMDLQQKVGMKHAVDAGTEIHLKAGMNLVLEAGMTVTLKAGGGFVTVGPAGVAISGTTVLINSGGAPASGSGCAPDAARAPAEAAKADAGGVPQAPAAPRPPKAVTFSPSAAALKRASQDGAPFTDLPGAV